MRKSFVFLTTYVNETSTIEVPNTQDSGHLYCVRGLSSDLISRDFETMGPTVAFVCFGLPKTLQPGKLLNVSSSPERDLLQSFQFFKGTIPLSASQLSVVGDSKILTMTRRKLRGSVSQLRTAEGFFKFHVCPMVLAPCVDDVIRHPRAFPKKSLGLYRSVAALTQSTIWGLALVRKWFLSFKAFADSLAVKRNTQAKMQWQFLPRRREAPFLRLQSMRNDVEVMGVSVDKRKTYLSEKSSLINVATQQENDTSSWTSTSSASSHVIRQSTEWDAKVENASIVYALTKFVARRIKHDPEWVRSAECKPVPEELHGDRSATHDHRIILQDEILCVDEWLRQREKDDANVVMFALMVLVKIVDPPHHSRPQEDENSFHAPIRKQKVKDRDAPFPVNLLPHEERKKARESAFVHTGGEEKAYSSLSDEESTVDTQLESDSEPSKGSQHRRHKVDKTSIGKENLWNIVEVLRYRALLYAAMLELCADSSELVGDLTDLAVKII